MTLHVITITPNHIITVCDKLVSSPSYSGRDYIEVDNDTDKQFSFITDDARMTIAFAGFAGPRNKPKLTMEWLLSVIHNSSRSGIHTIEQHLNNICIAANGFISQFRQQGYPDEALRLTILATGWIATLENGKYRECQLHHVIENCLDGNHFWASKARPKFVQRFKFYNQAKFENGYYRIFLGNDHLGINQKAQLRVLTKFSKENNPKMIFRCSVDVIRSAANASRGTIGYNCIGIRNTKDDGGLECYGSRFDGEIGNPSGVILSTSAISMSVTDVRVSKT